MVHPYFFHNPDFENPLETGLLKIYNLIQTGEFFLFLHFSHQFCKNIWSKTFLQNYTSDAVGDGDRDLPPCPTAVGRRAVL
jgi:hypothetical protein